MSKLPAWFVLLLIIAIVGTFVVTVALFERPTPPAPPAVEESAASSEPPPAKTPSLPENETTVTLPTPVVLPAKLDPGISTPPAASLPLPAHGPAAAPASGTGNTAVEKGVAQASEAPARITLREGKIAIQTAAIAVCKQAGLEYDWNRSYNNTQPDCRRYIAVQLSNLSPDQALNEIVVKNGLKYRVEGKRVWLER